MRAGQSCALSVRGRELALIVMLAATGAPDFAFAVYVYWGLMQGLAVQDIAAIALLSGAYGGVATFVGGTNLLVSVLNTVSEEGPAGSRPSVD